MSTENLRTNMASVCRLASAEDLATMLTVLADECERRTRDDAAELIRLARFHLGGDNGD